jgi:hypothetical protein
MENDRSTPDVPDDAAADTAADLDATDDFDENDPMDKFDDAVMAADATGMLANERMITVAEIAEGDPDIAPGLLGGDQEP